MKRLFKPLTCAVLFALTPLYAGDKAARRAKLVKLPETNCSLDDIKHDIKLVLSILDEQDAASDALQVETVELMAQAAAQIRQYDAAIAECDRLEQQYQIQDQEIQADQLRIALENQEDQQRQINDTLKRIERDLR
jgi:hypothetical protein